MVVASLVGCVHVPKVGRTVEEQIRFTEARSYQNWGGLLVGTGVSSILVGTLAGVVVGKAEQSIGGESSSGLLIIVSSLVVGAIQCIGGYQLIRIGNELADPFDAAPLPLPPSAPALTGPAQDFLSKCYEKCRRNSWQVGICQRDCDDAAKREDLTPTSTSSAASPLK